MRRSRPLSALVIVMLVLVIGAETPAWDIRMRAVSLTSGAMALGPPIPDEVRRWPHTVTLTFDDGPSAYTGRILDILRDNGVRATFCMLGENVARHPDTARRVAREGHQLCNHSVDHADMTRLSSRHVRHEVRAAQDRINRVTGVSPRLFRFPYGDSDRRTRRIVARLGLRDLRWDVDPTDWKRPRARVITARVVGHVRPGAVVLMHDGGGNRSHTADSLAATIRELRAKGYRFVPA